MADPRHCRMEFTLLLRDGRLARQSIGDSAGGRRFLHLVRRLCVPTPAFSRPYSTALKLSVANGRTWPPPVHHRAFDMIARGRPSLSVKNAIHSS